MSGLYVSSDDLKKLSKTTLQELLALCTKGISNKSNEPEQDEGTGDALDLSSGQANDLIRGLGSKSRAALTQAIKLIEAVGDGDRVGVWTNDIASAMGIEADELRGVWSGLTRRTRRVTNDPDAYLINWLPWDYDREDYFGIIHPTTVANLKRALDL